MKNLKARTRQIIHSFRVLDPLAQRKALNADPSQFGEAKIIAFMIDCFVRQGHKIPKVFLELGANCPYSLSSTWYLEKTLGFKGVSIDPNSEFSYVYSKHRKNTIFIDKAYVPLELKQKTINYFKSESNVLSTLDKKEAEEIQNMGYTVSVEEVETVTIDDISIYLQDRIGVLVLDIESLSLQLKILSELIHSNLKPFIICVETLDYSPFSKSQRDMYDKILENDYSFIAGTFLNSIYATKSLTT